MKKLLIISLLASIIPLSSAFAFRVSPMSAEFDPTGRGATQSFQIDNNGDKDVALEVEALTRKIDEKGKETREKTKDFIVYPLQLSVKVGEKKNIRVSFVGKESDKEVPYRLIVRQLPVELDRKAKKQKGTQINFLFEYVASLYLKPKNSPEIKLKLLSSKVENKKLELLVENVGNVHVLFKSYNVIFKNAGKKVELNMGQKEFDEVAGQNLLPENKRKISIPLSPEYSSLSDIELKFRESF